MAMDYERIYARDERIYARDDDALARLTRTGTESKTGISKLALVLRLCRTTQQSLVGITAGSNNRSKLADLRLEA